MTSRLSIPDTYVNNQLIDADHMNTYVRTNLSSIDSGYGCRVATAISQDITDSTWTALTFDAETFDDETMHDNSTNPSRITIKSAGRYLITGSLLYNQTNSAGNRVAAIYVNGVVYSYGFAKNAGNGANVDYVGVSDVIVAAANDYVELYTYQTSGATRTVTTRRFSVTKYI